MNELKTLDDIPVYHLTPQNCSILSDQDGFFISTAISKQDVKQKGIEWIKEFQRYNLDTETVVSYPGGYNYMFGGRCGIICFLKHFLNITEADLK